MILVTIPAKLLITTLYVPACAVVKFTKVKLLLVELGTFVPLRRHWKSGGGIPTPLPERSVRLPPCRTRYETGGFVDAAGGRPSRKRIFAVPLTPPAPSTTARNARGVFALKRSKLRMPAAAPLSSHFTKAAEGLVTNVRRLVSW